MKILLFVTCAFSFVSFGCSIGKVNSRGTGSASNQPKNVNSEIESADHTAYPAAHEVAVNQNAAPDVAKTSSQSSSVLQDATLGRKSSTVNGAVGGGLAS